MTVCDYETALSRNCTSWSLPVQALPAVVSGSVWLTLCLLPAPTRVSPPAPFGAVAQPVLFSPAMYRLQLSQPSPGHAAVGSLLLQAPGVLGLDVHPSVSGYYQYCRSAVPKVQLLNVALVFRSVARPMWFRRSPANPACRAASRLSAHISRRGSRTC